ncbi:MAG: hypothetical protein KY394_06995, partial [Actinobacteria bacterium]|nr:hypothetical protein [Actinomycetota bacterium]
LVTATTAVVGLVVTGARWAHRVSAGGVAATLVIAALRPIDAMWWVGLVFTAVAAAALFLPSVTQRVRKLPAAAGPPPAAVIPPLTLLAAPLIVGIAAIDAPRLPALVIGLSAPLFAYLYARVLPGGLWGVRILWPLLAGGLSPALGIPAGLVTGLLALGVAVVAWRPEVKASYHPPREVGTIFPIPPEMTPPEILDAARVDDKGRPL